MGKDSVKETVQGIIETYIAEAELFDEVLQYTEHSQNLASKGEYSALRDCLLNRGERIEAIARLEEKRKELEKSYTGRIQEDIQKAKEQAKAAYKRVIVSDNELRLVLSGLRLELEDKLSALKNGKIVVRTYDNMNALNSISMFLDKDR